MQSEHEWTTVITPRKKLLEFDFKELWNYRDLWSLFIKRDLVTTYKQTILGPVWFFVQPVLTMLMFIIVFGSIAGISTDGLPRPLFYLAGICMWQYFADCLTKTSSTFTANEAIFGKVYFPRLIVPLSIIVSNLVKFCIQLLLFTGIYLYFKSTGSIISANSYLLLFPVLVLMLAGLGFGFGILISSFTTKYRDLAILFTFIVQLWMYATPVIYPLSIMPPKQQKLMSLNPVTSIIETFKYAVFNQGTFSWGMLGYSFSFMIVLIIVGIIVFNKVQRSFMDTV